MELNDDGSIPTSFWKYNPEFRLDCRNLQEDLRAGRMDPEWQRQAAQAMEERAAGHFDDFKEKEFEEYWGQKQKVEWDVLAGHASKVRLEELLNDELFKVGDVWCFDHTFGRGKDAIRVEKECKIVSIDGKSITLAIPPGHLKFARRLERRTPSPDDEVVAISSPIVATGPRMVIDEATEKEETSAADEDARGKDSPTPAIIPNEVWWSEMVGELSVTDDGVCDSSASVTGALRSYPGAGNGHVDHRGIADIWDDHQLHDVFPGGAGLLICMENVGGGVLVRRARQNVYTIGQYIGPYRRFDAIDFCLAFARPGCANGRGSGLFLRTTVR